MAEQIIDACCLINLYASGKIEAIISACSEKFYVSEQVQNESLSIRQPDPNDSTLLVPKPLDLSEAISQNLICECRIEGDAETQAYLEFAAQIDDGEASCLAIAKSRGWIVATDDRKAIRLASESGITAITTPELIERWAKTNRPEDQEVARVLRCIERFARFRPRHGSPLCEWWTALSNSGP